MSSRANKPIRTLYARQHDLILPRLGVFLAGPTNPSGQMLGGWRRVIVDRLQEDERLNQRMVIVSPEPESGDWDELYPPKEELEDPQMLWEIQYLQLCDISVFWFPVYWSAEMAGPFAGNIGPTARWEFGYFLQEYLKDPQRRKVIVGGPEDAQKVSWARRMAAMHGLHWHGLAVEDKDQLVADSFIEEIASTLVANRY